VVERMLDDVRAWAQDTKLADGRRVIDQEWVQVNLGRVHAKLEFLRLANWRVAWLAQSGAALNPADASTIKVFGTEFYLEAFRLMFEVIGQPGYLKQDAPDSVLKSRLERYYRSLIILTFGGGVNEVQRDLIALFGLGMPMAKR
jgi:alkylation response protein AidB-like acyl-CoA dehydrogenase